MDKKFMGFVTLVVADVFSALWVVSSHSFQAGCWFGAAMSVTMLYGIAIFILLPAMAQRKQIWADIRWISNLKKSDFGRSFGQWPLWFAVGFPTLMIVAVAGMIVWMGSDPLAMFGAPKASAMPAAIVTLTALIGIGLSISFARPKT